MQIKEQETTTLPGGITLLALLAVMLGTAAVFVLTLAHPPVNAVVIVVCVLAELACLVGLGGLFIVNPNEAKVLQFFGTYVGTVKTSGLRWANPFYTKQHVSLRVRNFDSDRLKVNDRDGNPIEIGAVVVWRVADTASACFHVEDYQNYTHVQSEAALRNLATHHAYDAHDDGQVSLRGNTAAVADQLRREIQERLAEAGIEVIEARISHLAYAPEIAQAMLRRQQAGAVVAARQRIVEGAVGMVEMALQMLAKNRIVDLDEERKAAMVSNLLVVLCGERESQPIINTGTIHQ